MLFISFCIHTVYLTITLKMVHQPTDCCVHVGARAIHGLVHVAICAEVVSCKGNGTLNMAVCDFWGVDCGKPANW